MAASVDHTKAAAAMEMVGDGVVTTVVGEAEAVAKALGGDRFAMIMLVEDGAILHLHTMDQSSSLQRHTSVKCTGCLCYGHLATAQYQRLTWLRYLTPM